MKGIGLPNEARIGEGDIHQLRAGGFDTVKAFWYHDPAQLHALGLPVWLRLPDSEHRRADGSKFVPSASDYAAECAETIRRWRVAGVPLLGVQVDNEPDQMSSWGRDGMWNYQHFYRDVLTQLRPQAGGVPLGFPSVSTEADVTAWLRAGKDAIAASDFITIDAYWDKRGAMFHPSYGGLPLTASTMYPGKRIVVGEWGSSQFRWQPDDPQRVEAWAWEYPLYQSWLASQPAVTAGYIFIQGGTADWRGFFPPASLYPKLAESGDRYKPFYPATGPTTVGKDEWFVQTDQWWYSRKSSHYIKGAILDFYKRNAGFTFLGLPLTEPFPCSSLGGLTIQLFERGRAEVQPNGAITLGRVIADYYEGGSFAIYPLQGGPSRTLTTYPPTIHKRVGTHRRYSWISTTSCP